MISAALRPQGHTLRHDAIDQHIAQTDREMDKVELRLKRLEERATLRQKFIDDRGPAP